MTPQQRKTAVQCRSMLSMCVGLLDEVLNHAGDDEDCSCLLSSIPDALLGVDGVAAKVTDIVKELKGEGR